MISAALNRRQFVGTALATAALGTALGATLLHAQNTSALSDIEIIRQALKLHPGAGRYRSASELAAGLDRLERAWAHQPDRRSRFLTLGRCLASLQCGHSYPNFYNQSDAVKDALFGPLPRLPFSFRWIGGRMVVTGDAGGISGLPRGTVINSINGQRSADILRRLLPYVRADGGNDGKRISLLEISGKDAFETFDIWHGLIFGGSDADAIRIAGRQPDGQTINAEVGSASLASRNAAGQAAPSGNAPVWQWAMRDDGIALLTMDGWALYNSQWDWQGWLDERLSSLGGARGLIIDIRANEGGLDCGDAILARLAAQDLSFPSYQRRVRYRSTPEALNPYLDTWDNSFRTLGENAEAVGDGFYRLPAVEGAGIIAAKGPKISARVAVLTSAANSSATFAFAQKCRDSGLARLFGGATGGNRRGINGGSFFFVRLPDSGLEFDLPLVGTFPTTPQPDAGIQPDVAIAETAADIAAGRDPAMIAAADWLLRGSSA